MLPAVALMLGLVFSGCSSAGDDGISRIPEQDLVYELPAEYQAIFAESDYIQPDDITGKVPTGHTLMDFYADFIYRDCLETTFNSVERSGARRLIYFNWASYRDQGTADTPPVFDYLGSRDAYGFRSATSAEIRAMAAEASARGLDFVLGLELNYDLAYLAGPGAGGWDWNEYRAFIDDFITFLNDTGDAVATASSEDFAYKYWDNWFSAYTAFVVEQAVIAEDAGISMLIIGKQLAGAVRDANADRWGDLITEVRAVYSGDIAYAGVVSGSMGGTLYHELEQFPVDDLDAAVIVPWAEIMDVDDPGIAGLKSAFEDFHDTTAEALTGSSTGTPSVPVIYLNPFMSCSGAPRQVWFEPADHSNPDISQDLLIQARMYEAFFQSVQGRGWIDEVWSWGFWWRNRGDTMYRYGDSSFSKASSVRNKPAVEIMKKWSDVE
jgi:hypothetical protein